MDVASFALALSLVGQAGAEPFPPQAPPIPNVAAPTNATPSAQSRYGAPQSGTGGDRYGASAAPTAPAVPNYGTSPGYGTAPTYTAAGNAPASGASPSSYATPSAAPTQQYATPAYQPAYQPAVGTSMNGTATTGMAMPTAATAPLQNNEDKSGAGDLVRESLVLPKSLALPGRVTSLEELFNYVGDRRRQIDAVRTYWKLTADVADYHFAWQQTQFLKLLGETIDVVEKGPDQQRAKTENASRFAEAQARQREAEMKLAATQYELAERASLPTTNRQPLPRDLPHVGVYNTSFEKVYAHRTPPARAYLLNRTLPLWREIIAMRAETVWASQDAYDAAFDAYRKGGLEVDDVFLAIEELRERRSEFVGAVRRYNEEIVEYALTSAPEGTSRETLVGMLIKNSHTPKLGKAVAPADGEVRQVTYVDEFGNEVAAPIETDAEPSFAAPTIFEEPQASAKPGTLPKNALPQNTLPRNAIPPTREIEQTSATLPIMNVPVSRGDETSFGPPVAPARDVGAPPNVFEPSPAAAPLVAPPSPFPSAGSTTPTRGEPTLAPPQQSTEKAPLKFKVNKVPTEEFEASNALRRLPADVENQARPLVASSPYSSGTYLKRKPKHPAIIAPTMVGPTTVGPMTAEPPSFTNDDGPKLLTVPQTEAKPLVVEAKTETKAETAAAATTKVHVDTDVEPAGYYSQLSQLSPARRMQELVEQLHGARGLPATKDQPATLDQCMAGSASADRREIIQAYWRAAEQATRYRVWTQKLERLEVLGQSAMQFRDRPAGSVAMLQVRAEKLSVEAARRTTLVDLAAAQWTLTNDARRSLAAPWLMPSTPPHAGSYETKLAALPPAAGATPRLQAAAERIPKLHETLVYRADAVTAADAASDQTLQKFAAGQTTIATALHALGREARMTHDLLATVTRYNLDIAEYALVAVPGTAPRDALVGALVVDRMRR